jgi:hypothetical protein
MLRPLGSDPPRLFEDWAGPQRACAERELDLGTLAAQPFSSPTGSKTNSPKRALQVGFFFKSHLIVLLWIVAVGQCVVFASNAYIFPV